METSPSVPLFQALDTVLAELPDDGGRAALQTLAGVLRSRGSLPADVQVQIVRRPGVSTSLRLARSGQTGQTGQTGRPLFAMADVVAEGWLSVCFYAALISDPDERGEVIPGGLLGEDGHCFDLDGADDELAGYLADRLAEAAAAS